MKKNLLILKKQVPGSVLRHRTGFSLTLMAIFLLCLVVIPFGLKSQTDVQSWNWAYNNGGNDYNNFNGVATDNSGNVYATGYFQNQVTIGSTTLTSNGVYDVLVAKFDNDGNPLWAIGFGGISLDYGNAIEIGADGYIYVTGYFQNQVTINGTPYNSFGFRDMFVTKISPAGNIEWFQHGGDDFAYGFRIDVNNDGYVAITGSYYTSMQFSGSTLTLTNVGWSLDAFIALYNNSGVLQWVQNIGGEYDDEGKGIKVDDDENVLCTGYFIGTITLGEFTIVGAEWDTHVFLVKIDNSGNFTLAKSYGTNNGGEKAFSGLETDASGNIFIGGIYYAQTWQIGSDILQNSADGYYDCFLMKLNPSGDPIWARSGGSIGQDYLRGIDLDSEGNCYISGNFEFTAQFGSLAMSVVGNTDAFVLKYDPNGNALWALQAGGPSTDISESLAVNQNGDVFAGGYFYEYVNFGSIQLNSVSQQDFFIAKIVQGGEELLPPSNLSAIVSDNDVQLIWEAPAGKALTGYNVYRDGNLLNNVTATNYHDMNLPLGTYTYEVTAVYSNGESVPSNEVTANVNINPWTVTPTGFLHTIQIPVSAELLIYGEEMVPGDWLGVFYEDDNGNLICGGAGKINPFGSAVVLSYGDDITTTEKDGFAEGEMFKWRVFDFSELAEYFASATYDPTAPNQEYFATLGLSKLASIEAVEFQQNYLFAAGWNSMSTYLTPLTPDVEVLFAPIIENLTIVQNLTTVFWPEGNFNTIGNWDNQSGYVLKFSENTELQVNGSGFASNLLSFPTQGWYFMPVLSECPVNIQDLFGDQINEVIIIQELIGTNIYWPQFSINTLEELVPGNTYSIKVANGVNVEFPACDYQTSFKQSRPTSASTPWGTINFKPKRQLTVFLESALAEIQQGDMIGAFSPSGSVNGFLEINSLERNQVITLFGDDPTTVFEDGFVTNEMVCFKLYRQSTNEYFDVDVEYETFADNSTGLYIENSSAVVSNIMLKASSNEQDSRLLFHLFPNPASENTKLIIQGDLSGIFDLKLFDIQGKLVRALKAYDQMQIDVTSLKPGLYQVILSSDLETFSSKLIIE